MYSDVETLRPRNASFEALSKSFPRFLRGCFGTLSYGGSMSLRRGSEEKGLWVMLL
jgi:hypothetical protein